MNGGVEVEHNSTNTHLSLTISNPTLTVVNLNWVETAQCLRYVLSLRITVSMCLCNVWKLIPTPKGRYGY